MPTEESLNDLNRGEEKKKETEENGDTSLELIDIRDAKEAEDGNDPLFTETSDQSTGKKFLIYILFLVCFVLLTYFARGDEDTFYLVERLKGPLFSHEFDEGRGFENTDSIDDIYAFIKIVWLPFLFQNMTKLDPSLNYPYYPNYHNKLLGGARIRQLRVNDGSCSVPTKYNDKLNLCFDEYSKDARRTSPLCSINASACTWSDESVTKETTWFGQLGTYDGSGYVLDLSSTLTEEEAWGEIEQLRNENWISIGTRALFLDFQVYNPGVNLHAVCRQVFEIPASGGIRPKADFIGLKFNRYSRGNGKAQLTFEIFFLLFLVYFVYEELKELHVCSFAFRNKRKRYCCKHDKEHCKNYWKDGWNILDWVIIFIMTIVICVRIASLVKAADLDPVFVTKYQSARQIVDLFLAENYLTAIGAFLIWIKLFKFFTFSQRIMFLYRTFQKASVDLFFFLILFIIFFLGFAQCGYLAFSGDTQDFRSFPISIVTLFKAVTGDMNFEDLQNSNRWLGPLYFIFFQICVLLILMNVFLAIITDAYGVIREEDKEADTKDLGKLKGMFEGMKGRFGKLGSLFGSKKKEASQDKGTSDQETIEKLFNEADKDGDKTVSRQELTEQLEKEGYSKEDAELVMDKFDINKDGKIDKEEIEKIRIELNEAKNGNLKGVDLNMLQNRMKNLEDLMNKLLENVESLKK